MRDLLLQLDGKLPNLALMRLATHLKAAGREVVFRRVANAGSLERDLWEKPFDQVYGSLIFESTRPLAEKVLKIHPDAILGGTGWNLTATLEVIGVPRETRQDYSLYPSYLDSIGFTQRGCRLKCGFCVVPRKEGKVFEEQTVAELWRGDPFPRHLALLDNDFFGQPRWRERLREIRDGGFRVSFTQGINARLLDDEAAAGIASVDYRDDSFSVKRIYTAWDSATDEDRLFRGLESLVRYGVKPDHVMVYMLIGYRKGETASDRIYRQAKLRAFGARPYPMPFTRSAELVGFQRWVIGAYDKRVSWEAWERAHYDPRRLGLYNETPLFGEVS